VKNWRFISWGRNGTIGQMYRINGMNCHSLSEKWMFRYVRIKYHNSTDTGTQWSRSEKNGHIWKSRDCCGKILLLGTRKATFFNVSSVFFPGTVEKQFAKRWSFLSPYICRSLKSIELLQSFSKTVRMFPWIQLIVSWSWRGDTAREAKLHWLKWRLSHL
jgi:hypothetical protein